MKWDSELPRTDGIYWVRSTLAGSPGKFWSPFISEIRVNGDGCDVFQMGFPGPCFILPNQGYLFSEEVTAPDV
jgi:hypothetical protein